MQLEATKTEFRHLIFKQRSYWSQQTAKVLNTSETQKFLLTT